MPRLSFSPDGSFLVAAGLHVVGETQATATTTALEVIIWIYPAPRLLVTTKIVAFLIGNRNPNLHLPRILGGGDLSHNV